MAMPDNGGVSDATLRLLNLDRSTYDRLKNTFQQDMDLMGVYDFVLLLIKNFCLHKKDDVVELVKNEGLRIVTREKHVFDRPEAVRFAIIRAQAKGTPLDVEEHAATLESLLEGPSEAVLVAGTEAGQKLRELLGPADPQIARRSHPASLRARFGGNRLSENGLHCSLQREEANQELSLVFPNYIEMLRADGYSSHVDQWLWTLWRNEPHKNLINSSFLNIARYSSRHADRYGELREMLSAILGFFIRSILSVFNMLSSLTSTPNATPSSYHQATTSESILSGTEEEEIARAVLADELGIVFSELSQQPQSSIRAKGQPNLPSVSQHRELGESAREKLFTNQRPGSPKESSPDPPDVRRSAYTQRPTTSGFSGVNSAADMYRRSNRNMNMHHSERTLQRETSDITDELLDLHGTGALFL
ncbi:uncharacterized protein LOC129590196 [Paramacrobiotus metropolitanus]|uniref:uncharacterized protein LOC129590196 n=1 Tax=Paramacrobiotus metropolitanus TaxID=2943436 RepID=UPI002445F283|nr:uncharacterized protein LOC129590196 [Paramacrobiotus metropolitanus]